MRSVRPNLSWDVLNILTQVAELMPIRDQRVPFGSPLSRNLPGIRIQHTSYTTRCRLCDKSRADHAQIFSRPLQANTSMRRDGKASPSSSPSFFVQHVQRNIDAKRAEVFWVLSLVADFLVVFFSSYILL